MLQSQTLIETLGWYNRKVNAAMAEVLAPHRELLEEPGTTYFGSILDLLSHVLLSDLRWLRRIGAAESETTRPNAGPAVLDLEFTSLSDRPFTGFDEWKRHREELDEFIEAYTAALGAEGLANDITYSRSDGSRFTQPLWQMLLHMFNHETHHRGQLAQVLDDRGVQNDFSNLIHYLRE